jgi:prepilin signal peptidase PulO-like enzyme (type II secretory pathway)
MLSLYLALIGLLVGLALDALIVRLAVAPDGEDEDVLDEVEGEEAPAQERKVIHRPARAHGAEAGSLILSRDKSGRAWARRLLIVGATAGLFAIAASRYDDVSHLALVTAYVCVLLVCAATDALTFRVPNVVTYPAIVGALAAGAFMPGADLLEAIAGGALAGGVLLLPALLTGGVGMGIGDVKLAAFAGLALGFGNVAPALLFMALAGGAVAVLLLVSGLRKRGEPIPYAPFISAGALAALLWQGAAFVSLA